MCSTYLTPHAHVNQHGTATMHSPQHTRQLQILAPPCPHRRRRTCSTRVTSYINTVIHWCGREERGGGGGTCTAAAAPGTRCISLPHARAPTEQPAAARSPAQALLGCSGGTLHTCYTIQSRVNRAHHTTAASHLLSAAHAHDRDSGVWYGSASAAKRFRPWRLTSRRVTCGENAHCTTGGGGSRTGFGTVGER